MQRAESVDDYIENAEHWRPELERLREVLTSTELEETVKWGGPCYTLDGKNIVGMGAFKSYVGLWFHQGALLSDPEGMLVNASEGKTKALRQWRFTSGKDIKPRLIKKYVNEAIETRVSPRCSSCPTPRPRTPSCAATAARRTHRPAQSRSPCTP